MKKLWFIAAAGALLLIAAVLLALHVQGVLQAAATKQLRTAGSPFDGLMVVVTGREATLTGKVLRETERQRALALLGDELRVAPALPLVSGLSPLRRVRDELLVQPRALGWSVLAATTAKIQLHGVAASILESQRIAESVRSAGLLGERLKDNMSADDELLMEASPLEPTLESSPRLDSAALRSALLAVTQLGEPWALLDLALPVQALRTQLIAHGMPLDAWEEGIAAEVVRLRIAHAAEHDARTEQQRLATLPSGHVLLAVRGADVLLKGELGSETLIQQLSNIVAKSYPQRRLHDEMMLSANRRPEPTPDVLTQALPSLPMASTGQLLALGIPGKGWTVLDAKAVSPDRAEALPAKAWPVGFDPRLGQTDLAATVAWLDGTSSSAKPLPTAHYPPHLLLAAYAQRVLLRGVVADEASRSQIASAARRMYVGRELIMDIRLDATRQAANSTLQTVLSFPPAPAPESTAIIAFVVPGEEWKSRAARLWLLEPAGFASSKLMPKSFPVNLVLPDLVEIAPYLKANQQTMIETSRELPGSVLLPTKK